MTSAVVLTPELELVRDSALKALNPILPAGPKTSANQDFLFAAQRTRAGRDLPPYYLVYFLLVDLLGFKDLGRFEKIAWSIPIDLNGRAFLIDYRKMGLGVFAHDAPAEEDAARQIVTCVQRGVKAAQPYFEWLASRAVQSSNLNVVNNSASLFSRFKFMMDAYHGKSKEAEARKEERVVETGTSSSGPWTSVRMPAYDLKIEARWLALAAIEAFFSWTEHVFIHLSILQGTVKTGNEVADLAEADWQTKFKSALDITDPDTKKFFDTLLAIRKELRNFVAHGAFGKQGEAFSFHSGTGAVPVLLPSLKGSRKFRLGNTLAFAEASAVATIEDFIKHLWSGPRAPAEIYIQQSGISLNLAMSADGTYGKAISSVASMTAFVKREVEIAGMSADMDW